MGDRPEGIPQRVPSKKRGIFGWAPARLKWPRSPGSRPVPCCSTRSRRRSAMSSSVSHSTSPLPALRHLLVSIRAHELHRAGAVLAHVGRAGRRGCGRRPGTAAPTARGCRRCPAAAPRGRDAPPRHRAPSAREAWTGRGGRNRHAPAMRRAYSRTSAPPACWVRVPLSSPLMRSAEFTSSRSSLRAPTDASLAERLAAPGQGGSLRRPVNERFRGADLGRPPACVGQLEGSAYNR